MLDRHLCWLIIVDRPITLNWSYCQSLVNKSMEEEFLVLQLFARTRSCRRGFVLCFKTSSTCERSGGQLVVSEWVSKTRVPGRFSKSEKTPPKYVNSQIPFVCHDSWFSAFLVQTICTLFEFLTSEINFLRILCRYVCIAIVSRFHYEWPSLAWRSILELYCL